MGISGPGAGEGKSLSRCPGEGKIHAAKTGGRYIAAKHSLGFRQATPSIWIYLEKNKRILISVQAEFNSLPATEKPAPFWAG